MSYSAKRSKRMLAGVLAAAMALTVTPILGFTGTAGAAHLDTADPIGEGNVCEGAPEEDPFTDIGDNDPAVDEIRCMVNTDPQITQGKTATTYEPNSFVQRRQMALFLQRVADLAEAQETSEDAIQELPEDDGESAFTDIDDEEADQQQAIRRLEDSGITEGVTATEFRPGDNVSRRQMAKFLVRLQNFLAGEDFEFATVNDCDDCFNDDDGDSGEEELNILAREGVFIGTGGEEDQHNVSPGDEITRRQMAFVLTRKLEVLFEAGLIDRLFEDAGQATATDLPEIVSSMIVSTVTVQQATITNPAGTTIRYTFDEPVGTPNAGAFRAYRSADATEYSGDAIATNTTGDNRNVFIRFTDADLTTTSGAAALSVAAVDEGAVTDVGGNGNAFSDAPIGASGSTQAQAGVTVAPDLVSVGNFRQTGNADVSMGAGFTTVDFTFDQNANVVTTAGYSLVLTASGLALNNEVVTDAAPAGVVECTGPTSAEEPGQAGNTTPNRGGHGTMVISVVCPNLPGAAASPIQASQVARGVIEPGTVESVGTGVDNVQQAAAVTGGSPWPDLTSVAFNAGGATSDLAIFTFSEPVTNVVPALFTVYNSAGTEQPGATPVTTSADGRSVSVTIPNGFADNAVGGSVEDNAVDASTGTQPREGRRDEAPGNPVSATTITSGRTNAPDLVSVQLAPIQDAFNQTTGHRGIYTFDQAFGTGANGIEDGEAGSLVLYLEDGSRLNCDGNAADETLVNDPSQIAGQQTRVICSSWTTSGTQPRASGATVPATPTAAQIGSATVGAVDQGIVANGSGANPIGAEVITAAS